MWSPSYPNCLASFLPWFQIDVRRGFSFWLRVSNPFWWSCWPMASGNIWFLSLPNHGFVPTHTLVLFPMRHASPSPTTWKDLIIVFHIMEILALFLFGFHTQSSMDSGWIYFCKTTIVHRFSLVMILLIDSVANAVENSNFFLSPQVPRSFGIASLFQWTHGNTSWCFAPFHRNLKHNSLAFSRIYFSVHARDIQYTRIASNTDFTSTNLPALEIHPKLQTFNLFSN